MIAKLAVLALACLISSAFTQKIRYDQYEVISVVPRTTAQLQLLADIQTASTGLSFWREPSKVNVPTKIMVPPHLKQSFQQFIESNKLETSVQIPNVQVLLDEENKLFERRPKASVEWKSYHTLEEIYQWLDELEDQNENVRTVIGGSTYEGRDIKGIEIINGPNLPGVVIESGIHAREWIGPAASSWIINEAINSPSNSVWKQFNFLYFPSVNPDGFKFTQTKDRMWRKTRKPYLGGLCMGADPNRNWDFHWMEGGASNNPCAEDFAGSGPFSEIETASLSKYLTSVSSSYDIYISFHSFSQLLMFPWGYTGQHAPLHELWQRIGDLAADDLEAVHGTYFDVGSIYETIYPASGSSIEWYYGLFNSTLTYTFECRDTGDFGFVLPADQIIPTGEEHQAAIERMLLEYQKLNIK